MTPSAAWEQHRKRVQEKFPEDYPIKFGDRHICPDYFWVFNFYRKWITDKLGSYDGVDAYAKIVYFSTFYKLCDNGFGQVHIKLKREIEHPYFNCFENWFTVTLKNFSKKLLLK